MYIMNRPDTLIFAVYYRYWDIKNRFFIHGQLYRGYKGLISCILGLHIDILVRTELVD
jgi:hypothetical protein